jgi:hypothetical protein
MLDEMYKGKYSDPSSYSTYYLLSNTNILLFVNIDHILPASEFIADFDLTLGIDVS